MPSSRDSQYDKQYTIAVFSGFSMSSAVTPAGIAVAPAVIPVASAAYAWAGGCYTYCAGACCCTGCAGVGCATCYGRGCLTGSGTFYSSYCTSYGYGFGYTIGSFGCITDGVTYCIGLIAYKLKAINNLPSSNSILSPFIIILGGGIHGLF